MVLRSDLVIYEETCLLYFFQASNEQDFSIMTVAKMNQNLIDLVNTGDVEAPMCEEFKKMLSGLK